MWYENYAGANYLLTKFNPVDDIELQVEQNIEEFKKAKAAWSCI